MNYPRHPQHNANIERLNKTIEDEFLNNNLEYIEDEKYFNHNLINYLIFYNKNRPHKSLNYMSPSDYLINNLNFSNMLWTSAKI
jgi:putative transposase